MVLAFRDEKATATLAVFVVSLLLIYIIMII